MLGEFGQHRRAPLRPQLVLDHPLTQRADLSAGLAGQQTGEALHPPAAERLLVAQAEPVEQQRRRLPRQKPAIGAGLAVEPQVAPDATPHFARAQRAFEVGKDDALDCLTHVSISITVCRYCTIDSTNSSD
jgi:hypothetical protein